MTYFLCTRQPKTRKWVFLPFTKRMAGALLRLVDCCGRSAASCNRTRFKAWPDRCRAAATSEARSPRAGY
ncbi:hypothetical protein F751_2007 [Auxenochlorella protothecoides]|uniref:Uncharacterized protein n=1 Tax=Auxenochlorella protothecoides TaxID=3075 RepID=A0A087SHC4_AUXPR|nr:hypothetical protein F751_2007 [Auxenochlorella protothecoides]KFM25128.1 hypothetical protein F751_2007 [Auxenochlorella protothecoides]